MNNSNKQNSNRITFGVVIYRPKLPTLLHFACLAMFLLLTACTSTKSVSLYQEIGGQERIASITDFFIEEISYQQDIAKYFQNTNIERFREKLNEHLCMISDGPCQYTGDSMLDVHRGMNINENHFNAVVELLINAMDKAKIPMTTQNRILARLAPMRSDITYK